ncbi:MAG TPA: hypothetical protein VFP04_03295, partial [Nitrospira sp.]|nr:hypothetical protein [Nitrospira sp.]
MRITQPTSTRLQHVFVLAFTLGCIIVSLMGSMSLAADIVPTKFVTPNGMTVLVLEQHFLP